MGHISVTIYLMSFTCAFLSPVRVMFVAVRDSPKLDEPCVTDSCSIWSGSITGTLYFGSPAELPYVSAFIKTDLLCVHQLTCYQIGWHFVTYSPSVFSSHLTLSTNCNHYRGRLLLESRTTHIYVTVAWILKIYVFRLLILLSLQHAAPIIRVQVTSL